MLLSLNKDKNGVVDQLEPIVTDIDTIDSSNIDLVEKMINQLIVDPAWTSDYKQPLFDVLSGILGIKVDSGSDVEKVLHTLKAKFDAIISTNKENKPAIEIFDDQSSDKPRSESAESQDDVFGITDEDNPIDDVEKEW